MAKGATVFRNTGCDGKTDLCFKYEGSVYEIDVKLASYRCIDSRWRCGEGLGKVKLPVYPLIVVPQTGADLSGWYCRWKSKPHTRLDRKKWHCPPGLENFWD